jgi:hypothetical protein
MKQSHADRRHREQRRAHVRKHCEQRSGVTVSRLAGREVTRRSIDRYYLFASAAETRHGLLAISGDMALFGRGNGSLNAVLSRSYPVIVHSKWMRMRGNKVADAGGALHSGPIKFSLVALVGGVRDYLMALVYFVSRWGRSMHRRYAVGEKPNLQEHANRQRPFDDAAIDEPQPSLGAGVSLGLRLRVF